MATTAMAKVGVTVKLDDGSEFLMFEGDTIHDLVFRSGKEEMTLTGKVRVICANTSAQRTGPDSCPPEPYVHKFITPYMLVIDASAEHEAVLVRVNISDIISIGAVDDGEDPNTVMVGPGSEFKSLDAVLAEVEDGATVKLAAGTYEAPLVINKSITLIGEEGTALSAPLVIGGSDAAVAAAAQTDETIDYTKIPGKTGIEVSLIGLNLTGDATITVEGADSFTMSGCTFGGHNLTAKTMPVAIKFRGDMLVNIDDNVFNEENEFSYNLIDCYARLKSGSSISGNTFNKGCCTHNQISLYGLANNADVYIDGNYAAESRNMVRIGFIGEPKGTVGMIGNSYDETDKDPAWAGLFLVQPYGNKTATFGGLKIEVSNTKMPDPDGQIGYIYAGKKDMQWTADNKPTVYVDGKKIVIPDSSVVQ